MASKRTSVIRPLSSILSTHSHVTDDTQLQIIHKSTATFNCEPFTPHQRHSAASHSFDTAFDIDDSATMSTNASNGSGGNQGPPPAPPPSPSSTAANNGSATGGAGSTNGTNGGNEPDDTNGGNEPDDTNSDNSGYAVNRYRNQTKKEDPYNSYRPPGPSK